MKKYIAALMILVLPTILLADIAAWVSKTDAEASAAFVKKQKEIKNFCAPCGDKTATTEAVKDVKAAPVKGEKDYWEVSVNGEAKDLAYIYYKTDDGRWRNVGIAVGVKVEGVELKDEVPEFIPDETLKSGKSGDTSAAASSNNKLTGRWHWTTDIFKSGAKGDMAHAKTFYEFRADGTFTEIIGEGTDLEITQKGRYDVQGDRLTTVAEIRGKSDSSAYTMQINEDGDTLTLTDFIGTHIWKRV